MENVNKEDIRFLIDREKSLMYYVFRMSKTKLVQELKPCFFCRKFRIPTEMQQTFERQDRKAPF